MWSIFVLGIAEVTGFAAVAVRQIDPSAVALLRGVEDARMNVKRITATVEIHRRWADRELLQDCVIKMDGQRRRIEILPGQTEAEVTIRDGDEFLQYRKTQHGDVHRYDTRRAVNRGDVAFDPRVLGLSDLMTCDLTVRDCVWHQRPEDVRLVGKDVIRSVNVWRVAATRGETVAEYWIEEPSFRIHRRTSEWPSARIVIDSYFDEDSGDSPFPTRVVCQRTVWDRRSERVYVVKRFDSSSEIAEDQFTLKSMALPINTAVIDDRISRIIGYWNGEGLSEHPVYKSKVPQNPAAPKPNGSWRLPFIGLNVLLLLALLAAVGWRRTRRGSREP